MHQAERIIALVSILWAVAGLGVQFFKAKGGGRTEYAVKSGNVLQGIIYNFTWAMTPKHKETIRLHMAHFAIGVVMHVGIFVGIIRILLILITPGMTSENPTWLGIYLIIAAGCALYLLFKRISSKETRLMSCPDDYISILLAIDFLLTSMLNGFGIISGDAFLIHATVLFFYLPLGKLRHALFFFVARTEYGARLGYRGVYPFKK
jgi:hypothetical protein